MSISKYKLALVILLPVLGLATAYALKRHQLTNRGELWDAWLAQRESIVRHHWAAAAGGRSDEALGSGARMLYEDKYSTLDGDAVDTARRITGAWLADVKVVCSQVEERSWLNLARGRLTLEVVDESKGRESQRDRHEIEFVREDGRWRMDRSSIFKYPLGDKVASDCESPVIRFDRRAAAESTPAAAAAEPAGATSPVFATSQWSAASRYAADAQTYLHNPTTASMEVVVGLRPKGTPACRALDERHGGILVGFGFSLHDERSQRQRAWLPPHSSTVVTVSVPILEPGQSPSQCFDVAGKAAVVTSTSDEWQELKFGEALPKSVATDTLPMSLGAATFFSQDKATGLWVMHALVVNRGGEMRYIGALDRQASCSTGRTEWAYGWMDGTQDLDTGPVELTPGGWFAFRQVFDVLGNKGPAQCKVGVTLRDFDQRVKQDGGRPMPVRITDVSGVLRTDAEVPLRKYGETEIGYP